jgi:hypothetical protein
MTQHHQCNNVVSQSALFARTRKEPSCVPMEINTATLEYEFLLPAETMQVPAVNGGHQGGITLRLATTQPPLATQFREHTKGISFIG